MVTIEVLPDKVLIDQVSFPVIDLETQVNGVAIVVGGLPQSVNETLDTMCTAGNYFEANMGSGFVRCYFGSVTKCMEGTFITVRTSKKQN